MPSPDRARKLATLLGLSETFGRELSEPALELMLAALDDVTPDELDAAAARCLHVCRFMPSVAELREAAGHAEPSLEDRAIRAWAEAWDAVTVHGSYTSVQFSDPVTVLVIGTMGGWPEFCRPAQGTEWHRKEFLETYRGLADECSSAEPRRLIGITERSGGRAETATVGATSDVKQLEGEGCDVAGEPTPDESRSWRDRLRELAEEIEE